MPLAWTTEARLNRAQSLAASERSYPRNTRIGRADRVVGGREPAHVSDQVFDLGRAGAKYPAGALATRQRIQREATSLLPLLEAREAKRGDEYQRVRRIERVRMIGALSLRPPFPQVLGYRTGRLVVAVLDHRGDQRARNLQGDLVAYTKKPTAPIEQVLRQFGRGPDLRRPPQRVHENPLPPHRRRIIGPKAAPAKFEHFLRKLAKFPRLLETEQRLPREYIRRQSSLDAPDREQSILRPGSSRRSGTPAE